jgi:ATP-dependent helicase/nuclease subunit A
VERAGGEYLDIINEFYSFVGEYEKVENSDFVTFLNYALNNKNEIKKDFNSTKLNQVRIITWHGSKGLQAPIVFICDANKNIVATNIEKNLFWREDDDVSFPFLKRRSKSDILKNFMNDGKAILEEEKFRLFYVAMTRAENELYICGIKRGREKKEKKEEEDEKYKSFYDLALDTMKDMEGRSYNLEFANKSIKYYIGAEEAGDDLDVEKKTAEETKDYSEFVSNLENISVSSAKREIYNPSQFFKHNDRDRIFEGVNADVMRGLAVHKLLEVLPSVERENREEIGNMYLNNMFGSLEEEDKNIIRERVEKILNSGEYSQFFGCNSRAEVSVVGEVEGMNISGQIDRLVELDDKIVVLDYKNTRRDYVNRDELPREYVKQLELYKKLVEQHYGSKAVECYILTTGFLRLIRVW